MNASPAARHPYLSPDGPRVLAHRGLVTAEAASHGVVENSFAAVAEAHAAGAEYVESDCHVTADGTVVLFHDDDLQRVADDPRRIADVRLHELEELMAERGGLITLAQALEAFPDLRFNLDVKAAAAAAGVGRLIAPQAERVLVTSFSDDRRLEALAAAHSAGATQRPATSPGSATVGRLIAARALRRAGRVRALLDGLDALQVPERQGPVRIVTRGLVRDAHALGVEVHVWTVNADDDMERLLDLGVDGLVTDRADAALAMVNERRTPSV
ncbi:glycerophosphoryl diester phosphodiesterase [Microbacterium sp. ru370.1]|uniref:glycerophosphodiester phosphodiesterase family protein n=1 Tax=unclassified Microbacterium TaxID=2609290 RepID=UPI0008871893|nr:MULTISPECIES: glycerophosphodiester phosphodiesterase family protein [unclassified Microbacterium]SDO74089.1 glycerophosphoryl diester phosphodiesterase [Microbacterium sp. ru370.1]SIT88015.1 glycerophosphoryl diester phosphodiesterase [Microbacterium sp. RU1D]